MKISYSKYMLDPVYRLNAFSGDKSYRSGFLIRVEYEPGKVGYADVHPWEEFGDESIDHQLDVLAAYQKNSNQELTRVLKRSLHFAKKDADARSAGVCLICEKAEKIYNNYLVAELGSWSANQTVKVVRDGFKILKVKMGDDLEGDTALLKAFVTLLKKGSSQTSMSRTTALKIRIDFNAKLSSDDFVEWFGQVKDWLYPNLDYIEDPFPYEPEVWDRISQKFQITFALDRENRDFQLPVSNRHIVVIKPAVDDPYWVIDQLKKTNPDSTTDLNYDFVFTSYMDHPLGIASAVFEAIEFNDRYPGHLLSCGMLTHNLYSENEFSKEIEVKNGQVHFPGQVGLGFEDQLDLVQWKDL